MWNVAVTHTRTTMITQVLELLLLSHLYHSCALKSVRKAFFDCLSVWLTKNRQRFHNKALMEDLTLPPPKATSLSPTSMKAGLLLKSPGNGLEEQSSGWGSSQGGIASLHHSAAACRGKKHNQTHFSRERSSFIVYAIILQVRKITGSVFQKCGLQTQFPLLPRVLQQQPQCNPVRLWCLV